MLFPVLATLFLRSAEGPQHGRLGPDLKEVIASQTLPSETLSSLHGSELSWKYL